MGKKKVNLIEKFINDNKLDFTGSGSDLNGNCVILAGYACYLGLSWDQLNDLMQISAYTSSSSESELERVFKYAEENNYGEYWKTPTAKKTYVF
ncbi:MAG: hypothetical protein M0R17_04700 [Candidatus Omnitrophica bacterium]|jgi:hypothetical protein|nr:hypothetical protein [Candidatus Omnitrophota bacterium]